MRKYFWFIALTLTLGTAKAKAAPMPAYDMASLLYATPLVVLVGEPDREVTENNRVAGCQVLKVIQDTRRQWNPSTGTLDSTGDTRFVSVGSTLPVLIPGVYRFEPHAFDRFKPALHNPGITIKPAKLLLFLLWHKATNTYMPISSGVKLIEEDKIWGFRQMGNPGPFLPHLQTAELLKVSPEQKYDEEALLKDMSLALDKVTQFKKDSQPPLDMAVLLSYLRLSDPKQRTFREDLISRQVAQIIAGNFPASLWWSFLKTNWSRLGYQEKRAFTEALRSRDNFEFLVIQPEVLTGIAADSSPEYFDFAPEIRRLYEDIKNDNKLKTVLGFSPQNAEQSRQMQARSRELANMAQNPRYVFTRDDIVALAYAREVKQSDHVLNFAKQRFGVNFEKYNSDLPLFHAIITYYQRVTNTPATELLAASTQYMQGGTRGADESIRLSIINLLQKSYEKGDERLMPILLNALQNNIDYNGGAWQVLSAMGSEKQAPKIIRMLAQASKYNDATSLLSLVLNIDKTGQPATLEALKELILDNGNRNQEYAIDIASYYSDPSLPPLVLQVAQDKNADKFARRSALESLGRLNYKPARAAVEQLSRDEMLDQAAAAALAAIGTKESLPFLIPILERPENIAFYAVKAIESITGQSFGAHQSLQSLQAAKEWARRQSLNTTN